MKERTKRFLSSILAFVMVLGLMPAFELTASAADGVTLNGQVYTEITSTTAVTLTSGYYYVGDDLEITGTESTKSGITISGEVHLYIPAGVTLTATGASVINEDAKRRMGGGAGIHVPEGSTLYIVGEGILIAQGGNAGNGGNGANASAPVQTSDYVYQGGGGGKGGYGGGGAGAGIGTPGGEGGSGGNGGARGPGQLGLEWAFTKPIMNPGGAGNPGSKGGASANVGAIYS